MKDINVGVADAFTLPEWCAPPTNADGVIFFIADDGVHGKELWKSDGTDTGTVLVKDINPGPASAFSTDYCAVPRAVLGGAVFFAADDGVAGLELWRSDGTAAGTMRVADIHPGTNGSNPSDLMLVGDTLYFAANDGRTGAELWKSDGRAGGTLRVADIDPDQSDQYPSPTQLTNVDGTLYFVARYGSTRNGPGGGLWTSDGTARGTTRVTDIFPNEFGAGPSELINFGGTLFFSAFTALWKSDGLSNGTIVVKDTNPYFIGAPQGLTAVGDTLYFSAARFQPSLQLSGRELWKSDGTTAGTTTLTVTSSIDVGAEPTGLVAVNGTLFFTAMDVTGNRQLWKSDGSARTTVPVQQIGTADPFSPPTSLGVAGGSPRYGYSVRIPVCENALQ